jgi:LuxR family maltose regulon positive regulatory protein
MPHDSSFGAWLKQRRKTLDLTQDALAALLGCSTEAISKIERGDRHPSRTLAERLANVLNVVPDQRAEFLRLARMQPSASGQPVQTASRQQAPTNVPQQPVNVSQPAPILATKLYRPRLRAERVRRPRLLARLDAGLAGPVSLIAAPLGFGKTTLLAEWLSQPEQRDLPVAWLALDAGDSDPLLFLRCLIAALQTIEPAIGRNVVNLLGSGQAPPLETLLPLLLNDLVRLPDGSILVLDDYHVIDAPAVHQALAFLLDHLPPQLHLVLATRVDPPLPLARLRARGQLTELRAQDLRFTPEEAATFLREVMGLSLTAEDVAALEERTEGWVAGLQLAALSLRNRPSEQRTEFINAFTGSHRFVVDYLVDEVLARQPAHLQTFLLHTSILAQLSGPLCDAVVRGDASAEVPATEIEEQAQSQAILEQLERSNLFLVPLDDARRWYRYHHLFAQVLQERLVSSTSPEAVVTLHRRASAWFEGQGLVVEAVQHALAANDWERAARLIEQRGLELLTRGQVHTVVSWLNTLPERQARAHPYLYVIHATAFFYLNQLEAAELRLQAAEACLSADTQDTGPVSSWATRPFSAVALPYFAVILCAGCPCCSRGWRSCRQRTCMVRASPG